MSKITLFTVKYGTDPSYDLELFGSVLSARCLNPDVHIHVMTDRELSDFDLPVDVTVMTQEEFQKWTHEGRAPHLIKMYAIERFLNYSTSPVVFFDTDIIFNRPPIALLHRVGPADTVMNAHEGTLQDHPYWKQTLAMLTESPTRMTDYPIDEHTAMFNSGIVGLMPEHVILMRDALRMALTCFAVNPEAPFNVEQLCTGTVLSSHTTVHTCEDVVDHYWGWRRRLIHCALGALRTRWRRRAISDAELRRLFSGMRRPHIDSRDRALARLRRVMHRTDDKLSFAYLCYLSAIRTARQEPELAEIWLDVCFDMISRAMDAQGTPHVNSADFHYLRRLSQKRTRWMTDDQRIKAQHYLQMSE